MAELTQYEFTQIVKKVAELQPIILYYRIQKLWPNQLPKREKGQENTDSTKVDMVNFLVKKASSTGNYTNLLNQL